MAKASTPVQHASVYCTVHSTQHQLGESTYFCLFCGVVGSSREWPRRSWKEKASNRLGPSRLIPALLADARSTLPCCALLCLAVLRCSVDVLSIQQDATIMTSNEINPRHLPSPAARSLIPSIHHSLRNLVLVKSHISLRLHNAARHVMTKRNLHLGFTGRSISGHSNTVNYLGCTWVD